ncbi:hypothetical protein AS850_00380 [Frondihabitans sp. 762G35]|uniref:hypothetical protein n=1 Tax=Frondihabitans sp. 762G35 TaxID=1446794 RepID=UPI000D1FE10D|nr:hypothetical protein [Frondihabitans sp. 762G35]ARC55531.1 hypothetical protein AS850_00380 [Frondihabitans sp. 762G35]
MSRLTHRRATTIGRALAGALAAALLVGAAPALAASASPAPPSAAAAAPAASAAVAPSTGRYTPVDTARVFGATVGTSPVTVAIAGKAGVPAQATAVVVNVEVSKPTATGYVRVTPAGRDASVATQEFTRGGTISNLATVKLVNGRIQVKLSAGTGTVFLDVAGFYSDDASASTYSPLANFRLFGSTVGTAPVRVPVAGVGGIPSDATAVAVNAEVSKPTSVGYVRVTPAGQDPAVAAQVFGRGQTISNLVVSKLSGGAVQVKLSAGSATVFLDVAGYYSPSSTGSVFVPIDTTRSYAGAVTTSSRVIPLAGTAGVPGTATAVMANAEVENPTAAGYVRITPAGTDASVATQVFSARQTISNLQIAKVANKGVQARVSAGSATLYLDVSGYFLDGSSGSGIGNDISWPQCGKAYPTDQAFGIVGVNNGLANNTNPCLADQIAWAMGSAGGTAQPQAALYVNTANPGPASSGWPTSNQYPSGTPVTNPYGTCTGTNSTPCAWMYGYARAYDDLNSRGVASPASFTWWLDVEAINTWQSSTAANRADLEGMTAAFTKAGAGVGIYALRSDWQAIVGSVPTTSSLSPLPNWIPIGPATLAAAQKACSGAPLTRGSIVMTQYVSGGFDYDNSCR